MVDTLICGAVAMAAPIPQFVLDLEATFKEVPVAVHFYDDTLDAHSVFDEVNDLFLPLGFGLYVDTVTHQSTSGHSWSAVYQDTIALPPFHYGVTTGISSLAHLPGRMNVFVLPYLGDSVGGFAYIPPYMDGEVRHSSDGVWVRADRFDTSTLIHEIGHFFGLYHVFQGVDFCGQNADWHDWYGYGVGDLVQDTPPIKPSWSCSSPTCVPSWPPFRPWSSYAHNNFMDYMDDTCRTAFTAGQVARMHAYMAVYRGEEYTELGTPQGDVNGDGIIGTMDLLFVLSCLAYEIEPGCAPADFDLNGAVTIFDLLVVLSNYQL